MNVALFPPKLDWLLVWASMFRCSGTFSNYLGYVKVACLIERADVCIFSHPAVRIAKDSVSKSGRFASREKCWIRRSRIDAMLRWAARKNSMAGLSASSASSAQVAALMGPTILQFSGPGDMQFALLFLVCYVFLLRMPTEALPMVAGDGSGQEVTQSVVWVDPAKGEIVLKLMCRKNRRGGSRLVRTCWCKECPRTCPVHVLGPIIQKLWPGEALLGGITAQVAVSKLRFMLAAIGVEKSECYRSHDIRRGHALDLQCAGAPLWKILEAGEWSSPAFMKYLDMHQLDRELVVQAHCGESDSDDE